MASHRKGSRVVTPTAALAVTMLLIAGGASRDAVAAIALGFMTTTVYNMAVRDEGCVQQGSTLALLALPALGAAALSPLLAPWPWLDEAGFVAAAMAAASARSLGPRGMALGMVAFIVYFLGAITHPSLGAMPLLALGTRVGLGASALMRFVVLPDDRAATMRHLAWLAGHDPRRDALHLSDTGMDDDRPARGAGKGDETFGRTGSAAHRGHEAARAAARGIGVGA